MTLAPGRINGIDLCPTIQTSVDFKKVKEAGFEFVYIKSSQYSSVKIGAFGRYVDQARNAGLRVGAYHFCSHDSSPENQAEFFHRASSGLGSAPGDLPPMADWEFCTASTYVPPKYPLGHPAHCVNWAERFMKTATESFYGQQIPKQLEKPRLPVIYTYPYYAIQHQPNLKGSLLGIYPMCYASYKSDHVGQLVGWVPAEGQGPLSKLQEPWDKWKLWQYSGNNGFPVPGIAGDCDRQVFNGSAGDWAEFLGICRPVHQSDPKPVIE